MGPAFDRVISALTAAGRQPRVYGSGKATAHCPGPGHYRGDQHPSLVITPGDGCALICCHAGCATGDVLAAIGLNPAGLFDEPRQPGPQAPAARRLRAAIGRARGLSGAERYLYLWLLGLADWDTAQIPLRFQPGGQRALAAACGLDRVTVQQSATHLARHDWLTVACGVPCCTRNLPHSGRGHRVVYRFAGIGDDCPGENCRARCRPVKAAQRSHLKVVSVLAIGLLSVPGAGSPLLPRTSSANRHLTCGFARPTQPFPGCESQPFSHPPREGTAS
jgi:hypothetical protein